MDANDHYYPVALLGFEDGENLFFEGSDWHAAYVPAMVQRGPFLVGLKEAQGPQGESHQARVMSIDLKHPRVSREDGELLFKPLGGRTEFLEERAGLLEVMRKAILPQRQIGQRIGKDSIGRHDILRGRRTGGNVVVGEKADQIAVVIDVDRQVGANQQHTSIKGQFARKNAGH